MEEIKLVFQLDEIEEAVAQFLDFSSGNKKFAFYGEMGAGKTTFITALCAALGTDDLVSSPTFAIINEYADADGEPIFHFDFYRIKEASELLDIGFYDYCEQDAFCFIEWPEKAEGLIPEDFMKVSIDVDDDNSRVISFWL
ncbi:MAG: tRNA (adenosine(37)-N6)-threonylcarbamoyltransferase complex ATPase subunit type 1 TsaE [Bacteroidales bacterium]|nr:tRNA (adenosine(37)-N6)-threonylcarbamoyltransferase complex ATPase subunit type 1 TsaE [Bacteroidales bacterium]